MKPSAQSHRRRIPSKILSAAQPEWIILLLLAVLFVASYTYNDILITTRQSIRLWDCVFQGRPLDFYQYNVGIVTGLSLYPVPQNASYDFTIYLIFGVWNFPLWILERFFHVPVMENLFCLIWPKLLMLFASFFAARSLRRIAGLLGLGETAERWVPFFWCSSVLVCSSMLMISQYDVISVVFILLGFEAYLRQNTRSFLLYFALATSCKYFALLIFLPLVLLRWKKILHVLLLSIGSLSISLFWKALFLLTSKTVEEPSMILTLMSTLVKSEISVGLYPASLFVLFTLAVVVYAYSQANDSDLQQENALYVSTASMIGFLVLTSIYPYWSILATPFLVLLCFSNRKQLKINLFLEMGLGASLVLQQMSVYDWCFSNRLLLPMLWGRLFPVSLDPKLGFGALLANIQSSIPFMSGVSAIMFCCAAALLILNTPKRMTGSKEFEVQLERSVVWFRILLFGLIGLAPILFYLYQVL